jgi:hypothetical protein
VHDLNLGGKKEPELPSHAMPLLEAADPEAVSALTDATASWWLHEAPTPRKKNQWPKDLNGSPAKIKLSLACMEKWHQRYREKRPDPPGPEAVVGKLIHGALEDAALRRIARARKVPFVATREELLHLLEHQPAQLLAEGEDLTINPSTFAEARSLMAQVEPVDFRFTLAVEHLWKLRVTVDLVVGGYLDRVDVMGDPAKPTTIMLPDYKTWQQLPSRDDLASDPQVGLTMAWARRRWPECDDIRFVHDNLRHNRRIVVEWNQGLDDFHLALARTAWKVQSIGDRTPNPGDECRRCPYREGDAAHKPCAAYLKELERTRFRNDREAQGGLERFSTEELLVIYREGSWAKNLQDERRKAAGKILKERLAGKKSYRVGDLLAIIGQDELRSFRGVDQMIVTLSELTGVSQARLMADLLDVRRTRLDEWVAALPAEKKKAVEAALERHVHTFLGEPSIEVRRLQSMF